MTRGKCGGCHGGRRGGGFGSGGNPSINAALMIMVLMVLMDLLCNRSRVQPKCPHHRRETEWALSWPAQATRGEVRMS